MPHPPIQVFLTTIASQPALRKRQEYILRVLQVKKVQFTSYDLASDENAKKLWRRKAPLDKQQLPGLLIGGEFLGTFQEFEEAVEFNELDQFLRLNDEWNPLEEDRPLLHAAPVGVPGAYVPAQMNPEHVSPLPSPTKAKMPRREGEVDAGDMLGDSSLHGVDVTEDDLEALVKELGLTGADAEDLVKGLAGDDGSAKKEPAAPPAAAKEEVAAPKEVPPSEEAAEDEPVVEKPAEPTKEETPAAAAENVQESEPKEPAVKPDVKVDLEGPAESEEAAKVEEPAPVDVVKAEPAVETEATATEDKKEV